jgi:hypothetical protein
VVGGELLVTLVVVSLVALMCWFGWLLRWWCWRCDHYEKKFFYADIRAQQHVDGTPRSNIRGKKELL